MRPRRPRPLLGLLLPRRRLHLWERRASAAIQRLWRKKSMRAQIESGKAFQLTEDSTGYKAVCVQHAPDVFRALRSGPFGLDDEEFLGRWVLFFICIV